MPPTANPPIVIVTGLPRSGTSMMMAMLDKGGMAVLADQQRRADVDNPRGYYEFERVKQLDKGDNAWLSQAEGKAVKVISALLKYLPETYAYQVLFMHRPLAEVIASQNKMLVHRGTAQSSPVADEKLAYLYEKHVEATVAWLEAQANMALLHVDYHQILATPAAQTAQINRFLGGHLDVRRMAQVVDPALYRNRSDA
jgi:hypothetical protein